MVFQVFVLIVFSVSALWAAQVGTGKPSKADVMQRTKKLQMPFIVNEGQTDERVAFYANTFGGTVFVTKEGEIVYSLPQRIYTGSNARSGDSNRGKKGGITPSSPKGGAGGFLKHSSPAPGTQRNKRQSNSEDNYEKRARGVVLKEIIVGGRIDKIKIKGEGKAITTVNDFRGNDPLKWKTRIPTYEVVTLGEVYDGVELKLKAYGNNVEKLFYVKPGTDPGVIRLRLSGARALRVNEEGQLEAETALGTVRFTKPRVYQESKVPSPAKKEKLSPAPFTKHDMDDEALGDTQDIEADYVVTDNEYGFKLGDYDRTQGIVIDPLLASTFLGGSGESGEDYGYSIAANASGSIYVAGHTLSGFPTSEDAWDVSYNGSGDAFVSKFSDDLTVLLASTLLGGSGKDSAYSLAISSDGCIYVTGNTESENFPTTNGAWDTSYNGREDAFVSKFSDDLTVLLASTLLGGSGKDSAYSLVISSDGCIYVTGNTESENFPTTNGTWDATYNGKADVFISKFNGNLTNLFASTYLGGTSNDFANSIAVDSCGNIYVAGRTQSPDFQTTENSYDTSYNGDNSGDNFGDGFVSKFDGNLTELLASTYLGGHFGDFINSIVIDSNGDVYVAGSTSSEDFPTTNGAYDTSHNYDYYGGPVYDAFVSKLNANLTDLLASTYLGVSGHNYCYSIAIDKTGNIYAVGYYYSYDRYRVYNNVFVRKLDGTLTSLIASIYLGGSTDELVSNYGYSLVIGPDGNVYVTGSTLSSDFPTTDGAFDTSYNGNVDAFVSRLNGDLTDIIASTYLGGSSNDQFGHTSIDIDQDENIYVTGVTISLDFPTTPGAYDNSHNGGWDVFVSKLTADLTSLLVSTYLGGSDSDFSSAIAIDSVGNVYVAGSTSSEDFPTTPDAYDIVNHRYTSDGFISKFSGDLTSLLASTYLGGSSGPDCIWSITIDSDGNIYVTGFAWSQDFPTTPGAYDTSYDADNAFVSKLNEDLTDLLASTFLGEGAVGNTIVIGSGGNIYVAGYTYSQDFPTTPNAYNTLYNGMTDGFISKFNGDLTNLLASTYLGGTSGDFVTSIAIDANENLYVTGWTNSSDFPTTDGAYDITYGRYEDVFISRLNGDLTSLLSSSYLGGSGSEYGMSIAIDSDGNVYVAGSTLSEDFPTTINAYDTSFNGALDAFISKFNRDLTILLASTYLGGSGQENAYSIAINKKGNIYISGMTSSSDFPITPDAFDISNYGRFDISLSKFDSNLSASPNVIPADVKIRPKIIIFKKKGILKAMIKLPSPYDVNKIVTNTVKCEGAEAVDGWVCSEQFIATFKRKEVDLYSGGELTVTGELEDGTKFEGSDMVKIIKTAKTVKK
ncbi:MAG: SBBP repeat-containing protein [Candidatus Brocadiaceae baterium WH-1]|nr:MAG: SBBP repeat-containing protein [Candidatus Jettenia sp. AMX2]